MNLRRNDVEKMIENSFDIKKEKAPPGKWLKFLLLFPCAHSLAREDRVASIFDFL